MPTFTTNFNLNKPLVNNPVDENLWGGQLNDNADSLDSLVKTARDDVTTTVNFAASPFTVTESNRNQVLLVDASGGNVVINLIAAATAENGFKLTVKKVDSSSNTVTVDGNASETIDGAATDVLSDQYDANKYICDGTNWSIEKPVTLPLTGILGYQVLTTSGTYTPTTGATSAIAVVVGGGGGGGGLNTTGGFEVAAGGGGAGGCAVARFVISGTVSYTIGAGGAGGNNSGGNGVDGGTTTLTGIAIATGGGGGAGSGASAPDSTITLGGNAGSGTTGDLLMTGGDGGSGYTANDSSLGGRGGDASFGGGGGRGAVGGQGGGTQLASSAGKNYGGGGGGAATSSYTFLSGSAGADGVIYILEF